mmetsp:Transcript_36097/g.83969  ORF Transcript_36097/g.83969 Transcript_36097/m.83969 type:complete len:169 (-) Transcript_36097:62-568(-)
MFAAGCFVLFVIVTSVVFATGTGHCTPRGQPCGHNQARKSLDGGLSLLQVTIQLQRGSVQEIAPATHTLAVNTSSQQAAPRARKQSGAGAVAGCDDCPEALLDIVDTGEQEEDEMVAASVQVSLLQTGLTHFVSPSRAQDVAHLHAVGIEDDDEALGLLDAAADWASY